MIDSVRELISKHLKTTLETVTVAGGYANTLASVQRLQQIGQTKLNAPYAIILEEERQASDGPGGSILLRSNTLTYVIDFTMLQDTAADGRSADEALNSLEADLEVALMGDRFRDGNAIDTKIISVSPTFIEPGQPEISRQMTIEVDYRHRDDDPRAQA